MSISRVVTRTILLKNKLSYELSATYCSSQVAVKESEENQLKQFETLYNITKKVRTKKPQKPPFVKNLMLGKFDTDILTYPELEKEDVEDLEANVSLVRKLVHQNHVVDYNSLEKTFRQNLSDHRAIGLQASQFINGRECNVTESLAFLEALSEHKIRYSILNNEQLGAHSFVKFGSDQLKTKYLHEIMKGNLLSALCFTECGAIDLSQFKTTAKLSSDSKTWILNGTKTWVVNGTSADIFIVLALTKTIVRDIIKEPKFSAFVVERNSPGISIHRNDSTGIETADITFTNVEIPVENILGQVHKAQDMLSSLTTEYRVSLGSLGITLTKKILNNLTKDILDRSDDAYQLYKMDAVREKIGEIVTSLYAMESITYLTSGLIDSYENQDVEVEGAIVKIFASENVLNASMTSLSLIGSPSVSDSHWANICHRDAVQLSLLNETNDSLKMILALLGLQHAGVELNEYIDRIRNPLFHSGLALRRMWTTRRNVEDNPKLDLELREYLHPSSLIASKHLEYCVKRLEFATEILLARHGPEIVNQHMDLRRLAAVMIDIYAMTACLGRASRSYCIGLQHGDYEMLIANSFCNYAMERVKANVMSIYVGEYKTNDVNFRAISKRVFKFKEYFLKHPLSRNF